MPKTNAQTNTDMADTALNPTRAVPPGGSAIVQVDLKFSGEQGAITFDPAALFNALKVQYGATKVYLEKDATSGHNIYSFVITV